MKQEPAGNRKKVLPLVTQGIPPPSGGREDVKVDPKFTSLIGFAKYKDTYGLAVHQAAALVIARRALGCKEKMPREIKRLLAPKEGQPHLSTWGKLFGIVKAARKKARKSGDYKKSWTIENYLTYAKLKIA
ncbi:MAG: hypothetical protein AB1441_03185 [Bacillota bacterium]